MAIRQIVAGANELAKIEKEILREKRVEHPGNKQDVLRGEYDE